MRPLPDVRPHVQQSLRDPPGVVFAKVDTEAEPGLSAAARITSIPTLMAFREGILVFSQPGAMNATALEQLITGIKGLDMEEVRAKVAAAAS
ncbi:putative thioredoxin-2 [Arthrobacter sp. Hiyo6]|nr:putative thioredoxin-2 [Arthrobacter sp. Hiyo6]